MKAKNQFVAINVAMLVASVLFPWATFTIYLNQTRFPGHHFSVATDLSAGVISVGLGLVPIFCLIVPRAQKRIAAVGYTILAPAILFFYGLGYVCSRFGACL